MDKKTAAVIVAAGSGRRMKSEINKVFMSLFDKTVIEYTVGAIKKSRYVSDIIIVARACDKERMEFLFANDNIRIVCGGETRRESVYNGLKAARGADFAVIHDGARALLKTSLLDNVIEEAFKFDAAACGVLEKDSLKTISEGFITGSLNREEIIKIQTPQVFSYDKIIFSHEAKENEGITVTDDCGLYERAFGKIKFVEGDYENIKITTPEDLTLAEGILRGNLHTR